MGLALLINKPDTIRRAILALLRKTPGFTGEKRLWRYIKKNTKPQESIVLSNIGVELGNKLHLLSLPILKFIPNGSKEVAWSDIQASSVELRNVIKGDNPNLDKDYYRAIALYFITTYGTIACNIFIVLKVLGLFETQSYKRAFFCAAWLIPNLYFLIQLIIYHFSKLESIRLSHIFWEAKPKELEKLLSKDDPKGVLSVIPSCMEDPQLVRNALYSHCLQNYPQRCITLLLGNDYYTEDKNILANTKENIRIVETIKNEFKSNYFKIEQFIARCKAMDNNTSKFAYLADIYNYICNWFEEKETELAFDKNPYPTNPFLIEHTFKAQKKHYHSRSQWCVSISKENKSSNGWDYALLDIFFKECQAVFNIKLSIFQRFKYLNVEHEKTKAGNLTAFLSLIGKKWTEHLNSEGKCILHFQEVESKENPLAYISIFDANTIAKPDYLTRKIAFMERNGNSNVGLIQSPRHVPIPEPTAAATASGIHSEWFLPISIGMSSYKSGFWLGFNGLFRYNAIKKIEGSFLAETLMEDIENSLKIIKHGYTIVTSPEYQCQTFSPIDLYGVQIQRQRWASGGFRTGSKFIADIFRGKYEKPEILEIMLRLNYILRLNLLPLVVTVTLLLEYPPYNAFFGIETIPLFLYLMTYADCLRSSSYKLKHYFDGLAVNVFLNFNYLRGTWTSFKVLVKKETFKVFKSDSGTTPSLKMPLGYFELFGLSFLVPYFVIKIIANTKVLYFWDLYPIYILICIVYGIARLIGYKTLIKNIREVIKIRS